MQHKMKGEKLKSMPCSELRSGTGVKSDCVLGIDPGFERVGLAFVKKNSDGKEEVVFSECFFTKKDLKHEQRLLLIGKRVSELCKKFKPQEMAIESIFLNSNQKTVTKVAEARGVIMSEVAKINIPIFEYSPPQIKLAITGYGRSDKKGVISMVKNLVKIDKKEMVDDEYDAIAIALTHLASRKIGYLST